MGVIVGTAGHIDHGKSLLVKYLTGTDPDRLKEEKQRGITIELGYVFMPVPDGGVISFIDVPGHEKFVRQMVAGTATVDCFLLVVAADEGIMPQTVEHLDILRLLGVEKGMVAITKCDLVDGEMQQLVESEVMDYLDGTVFSGLPIYMVSSLTGSGMEELRLALMQLAAETGERNAGGKFRLDVDRVFILEGFGTIIGGTAVSGTVSVGDEVEVQPGGRKYRVREMRVNANKDVKKGVAGDRIALNLVGLEKDQVYRGSCVGEPGYLKVRKSLDTSLTLLETADPLRRNQRVRFHSGTAEVMARAVPVDGDLVLPGETAFVHFQLESPMVALPDDRFVIRNYSPVLTIGGGRVLETGTRKVRKKYSRERVERLQVLDSGNLESILEGMLDEAGMEGIKARTVAEDTSIPLEEVMEVIGSMAENGRIVVIGDGSGSRFIWKSILDQASEELLEMIGQFHAGNPLSPGLQRSMPARILKGCSQDLVRKVVWELLDSGKIENRGNWIALREHPEDIPGEYADAVSDLKAEVESAGVKGFDISGHEDRNFTGALIQRGILLELDREIVVTAGKFEEVLSGVRSNFGDGGFSLAELRDFLDVSRKDALRWAELFDNNGHTVRSGDRRFFKG